MAELTRRALGQPLFVLSLDTELAWGSFDKGGLERHAEAYAGTRPAINALLALFAEHGIRATWALVGHLFLTSCSREGPDNHAEVLQPEYRWHPAGWLSHDPFSNVRRAPFFYAPDVVEKIRRCRVPQEIATHTFTHAILGDPECTEAVARSQIGAGMKVARRAGFEVRSLVFPRNSIGHLDTAARLGIRAYRGPGAYWYGGRGAAARAGHFLDQCLALTPPVYAEIAGRGDPPLYDLPASMFFPPRTGKWRGLPLSARVRKARRGIAAAIRRRAMFHLWFHPFNLAGAPELVEALAEVLATVSEESRKGNLRGAGMAEVADLLDGAEGGPA